MPRNKFNIDNNTDLKIAYGWISKKLQSPFFPFPDDTGKTLEAEKKFKQLSQFNDPDKMNTWCEFYLNSEQWKKLKNAIRAGRLRKRQIHLGGAEPIRRVDLTSKAHYILKSLSKHHGETLSKTIELYMEKAWLNLPEQND